MATEQPADSTGIIAPLTLLWFATLNGVTHQDHLVKNLLLAGSLFVVYGESNSGKTFIVLDIALAVAAGIPWRGRRTQRGLVIYVAGEGAASVRARVTAYRITHPDIDGGLPFAIIPQAVDFLSLDSIACLIEAVRAAESECGEKSVLIIIDTFARAIPGGNENDAQDVGLAVAGADRIRNETGACVGFVHHAGKDPTKGARGSSALRAATDTEILIEGQSGIRTATVSKQRDLESGQRMAFELVSVQVGTDPHEGEPITSCVVKHIDAEEQPAGATLELRGKAQRQFISAMRARTESTPDQIFSLGDLRKIGREIGLTKSTARSVVDALTASPYMKTCAFGYRFTDGRVEG
jgi:putative DNA primase/helicase